MTILFIWTLFHHDTQYNYTKKYQYMAWPIINAEYSGIGYNQRFIEISYNKIILYYMNISATDKVEIKNARYYSLVNVQTQTALYLGSGSKDFKAEKIMMDHLNPESLGQVWMIFEVDKGGILRNGCFEIVHTRSTLVLNRCKDTFFGKLKNFVSKAQPNEMRL